MVGFRQLYNLVVTPGLVKLVNFVCQWKSCMTVTARSRLARGRCVRRSIFVFFSCAFKAAREIIWSLTVLSNGRGTAAGIIQWRMMAARWSARFTIKRANATCLGSS